MDLTTTQMTLLSVPSFYILYNYFIPLDLSVMIEVIAMGYSAFIGTDAKMTHVNAEMGRIEHATTNSLNLLENLAEVEYIMSDKTGTLTQNNLSLVAVCCDETSSFMFGKKFDKIEVGEGSEETTACTLGEYAKKAEWAGEMIRCMTLCHDCSIIEIKDSTDKLVRKETMGASLDEQCFLK